MANIIKGVDYYINGFYIYLKNVVSNVGSFPRSTTNNGIHTVGNYYGAGASLEGSNSWSDTYLKTDFESKFRFEGTSIYIIVKHIPTGIMTKYKYPGTTWVTPDISISGDVPYPSTTTPNSLVNESYLGLTPPAVVTGIVRVTGTSYTGDLYKINGSNLDSNVSVSYHAYDENDNRLAYTSETNLFNVAVDGLDADNQVGDWYLENGSPITDYSFLNSTVKVCAESVGYTNCHDVNIGYTIPSPDSVNSDFLDGSFTIESELDIPVQGFNIYYDNNDDDSEVHFTVPPSALTNTDGVVSFTGNLWDFLVSAKDSAGQALENILNPLDFVKKTGQSVLNGWTKVIENADTGVKAVTDSLVNSPSELLDEQLSSNNLSGSDIQVYHPATLLEAAAEIDNSNVDDCCKLTNKTRLLALQKEMQMRWYEFQYFKRAFLTDENVSVITSAALWNSMTYGKTLAFDEEVIRVLKENNGVLIAGKLIDLV